MAMNNQTNTGQSGFTLVELMIVIAIVAVLSAVALPAYQDYVERSRRVDAMGALSSLATAMERYYTEENTYSGTTATVNSVPNSPNMFPAQAPLDGNTKFYNLTIPTATSTTYTLRATPINGQVGDGIIELNHLGRKFWDEDNNGSFSTSEQDWDIN
jgi:type IV pilus assembly protein PilE